MGRLVIVSNRVAVPREGGAARAGGLEVAIRAVFRQRPGLWFGWSGDTVASREEVKQRTTQHGGISYAVTDLTADEYHEYYSGFANRVLWPILHYRLDLAEFSHQDLSGYLEVNEHFAEMLHRHLQPDDIVWAHDYHLIPLARALRARGHRNLMGYFLHTPIPPPEVLAALPNHNRLIPALADYDLVGFQTDGDASNFGRYLIEECGFHSRDGRTFQTGNRTVRVGAFPVGIETDQYQRVARRSVRSPFAREVIDSLTGRALIVGVDRLDYSKGIALRMEAFGRFLAAYPEWRGKVTYLQITPKSRSDIQEYADMERVINSTAGRINGAYGEVSWTPIRYVNRAYSRSVLAGLFRSSRAALVTPLRDGMNLVAKEFIAAQDEENPGMLILSRFAGAAVELKDALLVNPYDPEGVGHTIARALAMPLDERRARQQRLHQVLANNDIKFWGERFLASLTAGRSPAKAGPAAIASGPTVSRRSAG